MLPLLLTLTQNFLPNTENTLNNCLSEKFDLKREGTVFGAIKSMVVTWLNTYGAKIKGKCDDEDIVGYIQQLRDREKY